MRSAIAAGAALVAVVGLVGAEGPALAETQTEFLNDERTYLWFHVEDAAAQALLPEGWVVSPPPGGPAAGANFLLILLERKLGVDPAGQALPGGVNNLMAVTVVPARAEGGEEAGPVIVGGISADPAVTPGFYQVYQPGSIRLVRSEETGGKDMAAAVSETWEVEGDDGTRLVLEIGYERGVASVTRFDNPVYSGADPEVFRIYRGHNGVEVLRSKPADVDRLNTFRLEAGGGIFAPVFDGSEEVVSVISLPWYFRETFLP
jgi:hypothetical protein